jgi:simple sugar transport system permease protein
MKKIKNYISENLVVIFFAVLCVLAYLIAGQAPYVVASDLINRVMRNSIMVLALIIPIMTGMGLNFGIVVGAMSAQAALIFITHWRLTGMMGIGVALVICTLISIVCGYLLGRLFNKTRGQEMITGMIAGYFGQGIYLLIFLVLMGTVIPFWDDQISISTGIGVKDTLNLIDGMKGALDGVLKLHLSTVLVIVFGILTAFTGYKLWREKDSMEKAERISCLAKWAGFGIGLLLLLVIPPVAAVVKKCSVPIATLFFILLVSVLCQFITRTKLGQDFRSVGNDIHIAEASGIDVSRIRILATIFSTVLASWGQLTFLQNMGTFSTYTAQQNVGTYAIAALLVGGATIDKANVKQAFTGVFLFQLLFLLAPAAGTKIFHDTQVGEYFRTVISNGVIAVALVLHAMNKLKQNAEEADL